MLALSQLHVLSGTRTRGVLAFILLVATLFFLALPSPRNGPPASGILGRHELEQLAGPASHFEQEYAPGQRRLRVFMPANSPGLNLCKTVMSAIALGYPLPTLLNWNGEYNRPEWHLARSHIAKLESLLAAIEALLEAADKDGHADDNDLALLVDAYDVWFQLPPSVLIQRYHRLNHEADQRVRRQWQNAQWFATVFPVAPPRQSILVTSGKHCHPDSESGSHPRYSHWPQSPMPQDMYGQDTDQLAQPLSDPARKYSKMRPRCVNSGVIMGTLGALRQALQRCKTKLDHVARGGRQLWSDQALLAEVIGDQEMRREWMRDLASTWNGSVSGYDLSRLSPEVRRIAEAALLGEDFEFGIGLDYNFTTVPPTCSAEEDGYFVRLNDEQALKDESLRAGVPGGVRVNGIPPELRGVNTHGPLSNVSWGDIPLYTDFYFGATPVGIHHNAYIDGLKAWRMQHWWNMTWFYPHLRELVSWNLQPLQDGHGHGESVKRQTKSVTVFEPARGSDPARFVPIDLDGVCQKKGDRPWHEALFGDGTGPLGV